MTNRETPLLSLTNVEVAYDGIILALRGVSLEVRPGQVVALLGANGAGKTTSLKAASGLIGAERGAITAGSVHYQGRRIAARSARELVRGGLVQVLEGRHCFAHLSVEDNLQTGGLSRWLPRAEARRRLEQIYAWFPRLRDKRKLAAGFTSGGEQQMVALGRALLSDPKLVLLDEPSMGLAPLVVEEIFEIIRKLNRDHGVSFLLAEQNATLALRYADFAYVLENGRVATNGRATELATQADIRALYLGDGSAFSRTERKRQVA